MMSNEPLFTGARAELLRAIRHVRNRWRLRVAVRGFAVLVAAALGTFLVSSYGLELFKFSPGAIVAFRVFTYLSLIGFGWWWFIRPVSRRVSDEQVALYLEEHEPSLQATVLSAVEESKKGERAAGAQYSPELVRRLIESAVAKVREIDMGPHGRAVPAEAVFGLSAPGRGGRGPHVPVRAGIPPARRQRAADTDARCGGVQPVPHRGHAG